MSDDSFLTTEEVLGYLKVNLRTVYRLIESMSGLAASASVHITRLWGEEPRVLYADRDKVQQLVMNLLANAVKFSPEGGRVDVIVRDGSAPGRVEIAVKDRGPGIPADDLDRIFEKYHQAGDASGGTGLGLTICHEIVLLHDGQIWAESQPEKGSLFRVDLPGAAESRARFSGMPDSYAVPMLSPVSEPIGQAADDYGYVSRPAAAHAAHDADGRPRSRPVSRPVSVEAISDMISEDPKMSETGTLPPLGDWWKLGNE
jgi:anti-sigma regulatory factor (Ser/Thr protein kinase)